MYSTMYTISVEELFLPLSNNVRNTNLVDIKVFDNNTYKLDPFLLKFLLK